MAAVTSEIVEVKRNAWPALGAKIGLIQIEVDIGDLLDATDLNVQLFDFDASCLVMNVGMEIVEAAENAVDGQIGLTTGAEYLAASDLDAAVGTQYSGGEGLANVIAAAGSKMVLTVDGDPGDTGKVRVWAIIADINDLEG